MLTPDQRRHTATELAANLDAANPGGAGLDVPQLAADLGLSLDQVRSALAVDGADPVHVWALRDHLQVAAGEHARPCSVLAETARTAARGWFPLRTRRG